MIEFIAEAFKWYGIKEITGPLHNENIVQMFKEVGHEWVKDDETAWCAAFAGYVLKQCGVDGTGKLNARSFLDVGEPTDNPKAGDLVVLWRGSKDSWKGHVGFYVTEREGLVYVLGGNQNNEVNIRPYNRARLLGYRTFDK